MLLLLTLACAPQEEPVCSDFPPSAVSTSESLRNEDSCGYWSVDVGAYMVVSVEITEPDVGCDMSLGEGVALEYDPSYSNLADTPTFDGGPKWTWQVFGDSPVTGARVDVVCEEGTAWAGLFDVVE